MEGKSYVELIESREIIRAKYKAEYDRVTAKKEKLWQSMDIGRWEIIDEFNKIDRVLLLKDKVYALSKMCTKDTQSLENLHKQFGYANKMNVEQLNKLIENTGKRFLLNMKAFTEEFYPTLNEGIQIWSSLNSYI